MRKLAFVVGLLMFLMAGGVLPVYAHDKKSDKEEFVLLAKKDSDYASISHWKLEDDAISLYYTGERNISNYYYRAYIVETEKGEMELVSQLQKQGHRILTTLTDSTGKEIYSYTSKLERDRNFVVVLPLDLLTHSGKEHGFAITIRSPDGSQEIVISTVNTISPYVILGLGIVIALIVLNKTYRKEVTR